MRRRPITGAGAVLSGPPSRPAIRPRSHAHLLVGPWSRPRSAYSRVLSAPVHPWWTFTRSRVLARWTFCPLVVYASGTPQERAGHHVPGNVPVAEHPHADRIHREARQRLALPGR